MARMKVPVAPNEQRGVCRLCGQVGRRTRTHVPARAAGNRQVARRAATTTTTDGQVVFSLEWPRLGGSWGYWFCADCNSGRTARWDKEYLGWQGTVWGLMGANGVNPRPLPPSMLHDADPGAFIRCLWAWLFATDETESLHAIHSSLADAIRNGEPVEPPDDLRLLLGVTLGLGGWLSATRPGSAIGRTMLGRSPLWTPPTPATEITALPRAVVVAPPFVVAFGSPDDNDGLGLFNPASWLRDAAGQRREVALLLPTVEVQKDANVRPWTSYSDIVVISPV